MPSIAELLGSLADQAGRLRYGVPTSVKERMARTGELPGAPVPTASGEEADRYAAGYLFGKQWPHVSAIVQPAVDRLKVSDLPLFGGSSPDLQRYAVAGGELGRLAAENEQRAAQAPPTRVASVSLADLLGL